LFLVLEGEIHAVKGSQEGRVLIATSIQEGEIFWGLGFFIEDAVMPVALQANRRTTLLIWERVDLMPVFRNNGAMSWSICQIMIRRMQVASGVVEELAFQPVVSRLAGLLLDVFGDTEGEFVSRELTLDHMAAHIGTTREVVCRHLYRFAEQGVIEISRTELKIQDRPLLQEHASRM
jgi:CRP-like cAMP-binding protein